MAPRSRRPSLRRWAWLLPAAGSLCLVLSVAVGRDGPADALFLAGSVILAVSVAALGGVAVQALFRASRRRAETAAGPEVAPAEASPPSSPFPPLSPGTAIPLLPGTPSPLRDTLTQRLGQGVTEHLAEALQQASRLSGRERSAALDVTERAYAARKVLLRRATATLAAADAATLRQLDDALPGAADLAAFVLDRLMLPPGDFADAVRFRPYLAGLEAADVAAVLGGIRTALRVAAATRLGGGPAGAARQAEPLVAVAVAALPAAMTAELAALVLENPDAADRIADDLSDTFAPVFELEDPPGGRSEDTAWQLPWRAEVTTAEVRALAARLGLREPDPAAVARLAAALRPGEEPGNTSG
jgi:hypothetical protein